MNKQARWMVAGLMMLNIASPRAEGEDEHAQHMAEETQGTEMSHEGHEMAQDTNHEMVHDAHNGMDHGTSPSPSQEMDHSSHGAMPAAATAAGLRDPHAWSDGYGFGPSHLGDLHPMGGVMVDRLEAVHEADNSFAAYELRGWYGYTYDRAVIKAEGEVDDGELHEATTELLWSHAIAPFWNSQIGLRHDSGSDPARNWFAIGIEGLAPYWFEIDANAYFGKDGRVAANLAAEYELLLTQRLILQPHLEVNLNGKSDSERLEGTGLTDAVAGIRLRYEISREFAPYIGIEWAGKFGSTAEMARSAGVETNEQRLVAGVRFWF